MNLNIFKKILDIGFFIKNNEFLISNGAILYGILIGENDVLSTLLINF